MAFLALAVIGFTTDDEVKVRGAYLLMAPAAWFVLVPLAHASLLSGIVLSLGTSAVSHYWGRLKQSPCPSRFVRVELAEYKRDPSKL